MRYAQIFSNKAWWIFEADAMPVFAPDIVTKDITNLNPQPQEGWDYDSATDNFSAPVIPQPTLADAQQARKDQITALYNKKLAAGFTSSTSGTEKTYPYNSTAEQTFDELYLMMSNNKVTYPRNVYDINDNPIPFNDQTSLMALFNDVLMFKATNNTKMHGYLSQVNACTAIDQVNAITVQF
ncbi:hypothetical protein [Desulfosporosinus sp. SB140]|uniref:hypothetical protein n=1 Tax=Desulfosporosinus paludis TaxID=3115649 RepID=UPI00388EEFB5